MTDTPLRFGPFTLDRAGRRLLRGSAAVDLNARYFDALCLLAAAPGELVTKDRFMAEVWSGIPVTDEALTQCIRTLRRALDDDAASPRYIATVPKYGYRFVGTIDDTRPTTIPAAIPAAPNPILFGGTLGGLVAGGIGGLLYGLAATSIAPAAQGGGASLLIVLVAIALIVGGLGAAGVSAGMALAQRRLPGSGPALIVGGSAGGLAVGALTELIGTDAFTLLIGHAPAQMTGAGEGALIGAATGFALWAGDRVKPHMRSLSAVLIGALAGLIVTSLGGYMFAGSLAALGDSFAASRLDLGHIGTLLDDSGFGGRSRAISAMLESAVFVGAICWATRRVSAAARP